VARYEIEDRRSGEVVSRHRTRQGALDAWRERVPERPVRIWRTFESGERRLVVEGTWHESG